MNAAVRRAERRDDAAGQGRARFYCDARREQVFVLLAGKPLKGENGFLSRLRREDEGARQHAVLEVQAAGISLPRHRRPLAVQVYRDVQGICLAGDNLGTPRKTGAAPIINDIVIFVNSVQHDRRLGVLRRAVKALFKKTADADIAVCDGEYRLPDAVGPLVEDVFRDAPTLGTEQNGAVIIVKFSHVTSFAERHTPCRA